ncbi:unnamed protein product [Merluccius merluccius]
MGSECRKPLQEPRRRSRGSKVAARNVDNGVTFASQSERFLGRSGEAKTELPKHGSVDRGKRRYVGSGPVGKTSQIITLDLLVIAAAATAAAAAAAATHGVRLATNKTRAAKPTGDTLLNRGISNMRGLHPIDRLALGQLRLLGKKTSWSLILLQLAYQADIGVDDAIIYRLHRAHSGKSKAAVDFRRTGVPLSPVSVLGEDAEVVLASPHWTQPHPTLDPVAPDTGPSLSRHRIRSQSTPDPVSPDTGPSLTQHRTRSHPTHLAASAGRGAS